MTASPMEGALRRLADGEVPDDLSIIYDDVHGLWGGTLVTVTALGAWEQLEWERGSAAPVVGRGTLAPAQVAELARLLLEVRAWEQETADAPSVPDESRATLAIRCAGAESVIWERFNDLERDRRIARVRNWLVVVADSLS